MEKSITTDFLIVGSGFGGTLLAMGLAKSGQRVVVVEKKSHPRFTIGESSTPIADMILRRLGRLYNLPFLYDLSRYGTWQKNHPELICGIKRGFSYYYHEPGKIFTSNSDHKNELLVAASQNNENSDTNWLRSDVDHFLVQQLKNCGVLFVERTEITITERNDEQKEWSVRAVSDQDDLSISCNWIIDATGSSSFSETHFGVQSTNKGFESHSYAIYSHVQEAGHWLEYLKSKEFKVGDYPYNPDHSALHHILEEGWMWMLRFNNNLLSTGFLVDGNTVRPNEVRNLEWHDIIKKYPSLNILFERAKLVNPPSGWIKSGRLQRKLNKVYGSGWVALTHTGGFVDPLHSTGIAHTLTGVEKLLEVFSRPANESKINEDLKIFQDKVFNELEGIDLLVSSCYYSRSHFPLFKASVMLYFAATVHYEQMRLRGEIPETFLCSGDSDISQMIWECHAEIKNWHQCGADKNDAGRLIKMIRQKIEPFNSVGLMDSSKKSMYRHTAVSL